MKVFSRLLVEVSTLASLLCAINVLAFGNILGFVGEAGLDIEQMKDGGYIVAGMTTSNNGDVSGNYGSYDVCGEAGQEREDRVVKMFGWKLR